MSFVRPEATAALWRWREVVAAAGVLALGIWWALGATGLLQWLGVALCAIGAILAAAGMQRGRFRNAQDGPGVVSVDEGQITYFGPLTGGAVALGDLSRVTLDPTGQPAHWRLAQRGQPDLMIPVTASGADQLFDAFATLEGIRTEHMLAKLKRPGSHPVVIWQKETVRLH